MTAREKLERILMWIEELEPIGESMEDDRTGDMKKALAKIKKLILK